MKDIAKLANTTSATVSYALNNKNTDIAKDTKEKILQIAKNLNYRPNLNARSLKS
jgi:LacI family transcriptional regulator